VNEYVEYIKSTNVTTVKNNYMDFEKNWVSASACLGVIIKERLEISAATNFAGSFSNYSGSKFKVPLFSLGAAFRF
jgi:hypothetical protein